jgi:hypothetical protein
MRFAAYGMCGDVTAKTVSAGPALTRTWSATVIGGLAEPVGRHPRDHYPGAPRSCQKEKTKWPRIFLSHHRNQRTRTY